MDQVVTHSTSVFKEVKKQESYGHLVKCLDVIEDYAIFTLDPEGFIQNWNHGARRITGYFPDEIIGNHFSIFHTEEDRLRNLPQYKLQLAHEKGRFEEEGWRVRKNGERFWASIIITALKNEHGEVVAFSQVTRDLSEKKEAEELLKKSEERLRLLIDNVQDYAIFMLNKDGIIETWNQGGSIIKGYSKAEVLGKHFSIFYPSEDIEAGKPEMALRMASGVNGKFEEAGWRITKEGKKIWANVVISAVRNENNEVIGFSKVTRDISQKKMIEDLEDSIRIRDEFISVASHELRTPVTRLLLNIQLMKRNGVNLTDREKKSLDVCESATKELSTLMDNLVDVTRLRLGKLEIRRTKTNITNSVLGVITRFKDEIRLSGNYLSFKHEGDIVGYWDQSRLEQLFSNLLSNSIKYAQGKPISMTLRKEEDNAIFIIKDEGPGIPYHLQSKVFERFERAADSKKISGLGLGLYVSKQIVLAHNGRISLESRPGEGATFEVVLPLKKPTKAPQTPS